MPSLIVPAWPLRLVDNAGAPRPGMAMVQTWRHPLLQPDLREETRLTDSSGHVAFPERKAWGNGLLYAYRAIANILQSGITVGFGPDVWVRARQDAKNSGGNFYVRGRSPPDTIVIHRDGVCPADDLPR